jgi:hypothetical protein
MQVAHALDVGAEPPQPLTMFEHRWLAFACQLGEYRLFAFEILVDSCPRPADGFGDRVDRSAMKALGNK